MKIKPISFLLLIALVQRVEAANINLIGQGDGITITTSQEFPNIPWASDSNLVGTAGMLNLSTQGYLTLSSVTDPDSYYNTTWIQPNDTSAPGWLNFAFSETVSLTQIAIWNCSFYRGRGVPSGSFTYSTGSDTSGVGNLIYSGNISLSSGSGNSWGSAPVSDLISFSQIDNVRAIRFNYAASSGDYTVLHKIAFIAGITPIPEPSTYGLMGIGAFGVAFATRRRKFKTT